MTAKPKGTPRPLRKADLPRPDPELDQRMAQYDQWVAERKLTFSSKVVPVDRSLSALQWVLPTEQVLKILGSARRFALTDCACRTKHNRCDAPRDVCLVINDYADRFLAQGKAREISLEEAAEKARLADEHGLVHLTLYRPDEHLYALCSCCSCCCHDLQMMARFNRPEMIAHSDYVARTDPEACSDCGACVDRCPFGARSLEDGTLAYDPAACYGCGLCVGVCPEEATVMVRREPA